MSYYYFTVMYYYRLYIIQGPLATLTVILNKQQQIKTKNEYPCKKKRLRSCLCGLDSYVVLFGNILLLNYHILIIF